MSGFFSASVNPKPAGPFHFTACSEQVRHWPCRRDLQPSAPPNSAGRVGDRNGVRVIQHCRHVSGRSGQMRFFGRPDIRAFAGRHAFPEFCKSSLMKPSASRGQIQRLIIRCTLGIKVGRQILVGITVPVGAPRSRFPCSGVVHIGLRGPQISYVIRLTRCRPCASFSNTASRHKAHARRRPAAPLFLDRESVHFLFRRNASPRIERLNRLADGARCWSRKSRAWRTLRHHAPVMTLVRIPDRRAQSGAVEVGPRRLPLSLPDHVGSPRRPSLEIQPARTIPIRFSERGIGDFQTTGFASQSVTRFDVIQ